MTVRIDGYSVDVVCYEHNIHARFETGEDQSREMEVHVRAREVASAKWREIAAQMILRHHDLVAESVWLRRPAIDASRRTRRITHTPMYVYIDVGASIIHVYPRVRANTCRTHTRTVRYRATLRRPFALVARLFGGLASHRLRAAISSHPSLATYPAVAPSLHVIFLFLRIASSISFAVPRTLRLHLLMPLPTTSSSPMSESGIEEVTSFFFQTPRLFPRIEIF